MEQVWESKGPVCLSSPWGEGTGAWRAVTVTERTGCPLTLPGGVFSEGLFRLGGKELASLNPKKPITGLWLGRGEVG